MINKTERFKERIKDMYDGEYELVSGKYINNKTKLTIRHNKCGHEWEITPTNFLNGKKCPNCANKNRGAKKKLSTEEVDFRISTEVGAEYTRLGEFKNVDTKLLMRHNKCGHEWEITMNMFLNRGRRCPKCSKVLKKDSSIFQENINIVFGENQYTLVSDYININSNVKIKHELCGNEFEMLANNFLYKKRGCPHCKSNKSKGEIMVNEILNRLNFKFNEQVSFKGFYNNNKKAPFKYDFEVLNLDEVVLLEYDGIQHFEPVKHFGGEKKFKLIQERDLIKNEYCKSNGYRLIRIPYYLSEKEVENLLIEKLGSSTTIETDIVEMTKLRE